MILGQELNKNYWSLKGCKDSKDLPRSTHRNGLCQFFLCGFGFFFISSSILYLNRTKEHCLSKPVPSSEENSSKRNIHSQLQCHILVLLSTAEDTPGISRCL